MDSLNHELIGVIGKFYSERELSNSSLKQIIENKILAIKGQGEFLTEAEKWRSLGDVLKAKTNFLIRDYNYQQFPNFKLAIELDNNYGELTSRKSIVIVASLLCPYYTYFFEFRVSTRIVDGFLPLGKIAFFNDKRLDNLKIQFNSNLIDENLNRLFPNWNFVNHYYLMHARVDGLLPINGQYATDRKFSIYEFLFDNEMRYTIFQ